MDTTKIYPPDSILSRFLRSWSDFETALDMEPVDHLMRRVEALERRVARLSAAPSPAPMQSPKEI